MHGPVYAYASEWLHIHLNCSMVSDNLQELDHESFNMDSEWFHGFTYFTSEILLIFYKRKKSWIVNHLIWVF